MARNGSASLALSLAEDVRKRYNLSRPIDLIDLAEKLGVDVYFRPFSDEIDGFYLALPGIKPVIAINNIGAKSPRRQRFTLAHEIGHHLLAHRTGCADIIGYDTRNAKDTAAERTCDRFASELLMPETDVRSRLADVNPDGGNPIGTLADFFEVSEAAMENRLIELGLRKRPKRQIK